MATHELTQPAFDYITTESYRKLLTNDHEELEKCLSSGAWKAALVLAGSIVEALLVEHLEWVGTKKGEKSPHNMTFDQAIDACVGAKQLSETTGKVCGAIKDYRNLIHPGRILRNKGTAPDQSNAMISAALVTKIAGEISSVRSAQSGLTADQLLRKIETDSGCMPILVHLVRAMRQSETERLIASVLPDAYTKHSLDDSLYLVDRSVLSRISGAYRLAVEQSPLAIKQAAAKQFKDLVHDGAEAEIMLFSEAFFRPADIEHLESEDRSIVIDYLIGNVVGRTDGDFRQTQGLARFLSPEQVGGWLSASLKQVLTSEAMPNATQYLTFELPTLPEDTKPKATAHLKQLARAHKSRGNTKYQSTLTELMEWVDFPF
ncbi:hypothetical protein CXF96_01585 [Stenotrophomonas sp. Betaine-02u-21]|nr:MULTISPECIES: hypothetical protein [unclassified Stenotrophomonas]PKH74094.1 hypothetical protein CXF90_05165 [Stenotrophomonas sp. Betaine-02u-23]PKH76058.1 hypothetical protein CXF96_01585 [Stenotrophomonas sp. Betaine-02u-21]PKH95944.1 hypothetical protein CXG43_09940 [Stenotrophomonas sp. Bg11-02]